MTSSRVLAWTADDVGILDHKNMAPVTTAPETTAPHPAAILAETAHPDTLHTAAPDATSHLNFAHFDFGLPAEAQVPAVSSIGDGSEDTQWAPLHQSVQTDADTATDTSATDSFVHSAAASSAAPAAYAVQAEVATTSGDSFSSDDSSSALVARGAPTSGMVSDDIQSVVDNAAIAHSSSSMASESGFSSSMETTASGKNVLLISLDDMSAFAAIHSLYPGVLQTPNIDKLMAMGTTFDNAYATTSLCNPSRTAILSGQLPTTTGIFDNVPTWYNSVDPSSTVFAQFLNGGYEVDGGGKLFHNQSFPSNVTSQMFNSFFTPTRVDAQESIAVVGFNFIPFQGNPAELHDSQMSAWGASELQSYTGTQPFFLSVGLDSNHAPWLIPQQYYDLYPLGSLPLPNYDPNQVADMLNIPSFMLDRKYPAGPVEAQPDNLQKALQSYFASITYADAQIGTLINAMSQAQLDNTAIVLYSDHGLHMGDKDVLGKFTLWDDSLRVPLVIVDPGVSTPGSTVDTAVSLLDIYPTLTDIAGLPTPSTVEGESLLPLIEDPTNSSGNFVEQPVLSFMYGSWSLRTDDWRYIHYEDGSEELYNVQTDPHDDTNLASNPDYASIKAELLSVGVADLATKGWIQGTDATATTLLGTSSADTMSSPSPDVTYEGGAGNDTYFLWTSTQQVVEQPNEGIDTVYIYFSNYTIPDNVENVSTEQFSGLSPKFNITGNSLDNHIIGQANDDVLLGMGGSDVLEGFWGNDVLNGGDGNDILDGHIGNDILIGGSGDNVLAGGHDIDTADYSSDPAGITMNLTMQGQNTTNGWGGLDTLTSIENVIGTSFADNIIANGANNVITTGGGNDVINGGAGNDTIIAGMGEVSFQGGVGNDTFVMGATWDTGDLIDGGSGIDTISLSGDYSAGVAVSLDMMSHVEVISLGAGFSYNFTFANNDVGPGLSLTIDGSALGAGDSLTVNAFHDTDSIYIVKGGAGNDNIETGQGNDIISAGSGGTDIIDAQGGNDTIDMGAGLDSTDTIDGGTGTDTVTLEGDYSAGFTFGNTTMLNVENLVLGAGFSYNLTFANSTVAAGTTFTVDASKLGAANSLVFSGQHESDGQFDIIGGAGNDNIIGGAGNDIFNMAKGGEDTILAGAGDDKFIFGAAFDAGDTINGGTGNNTLTLNGNYTGANALVFGATTMTNVGLVFLSDDSNYDITTNDATVASGQTLTIQATDLEKKFSLTFDGSAETNGSFIIDGGAGIDTVIGGARNDTFNMAAGAGRDTIDGGTGDDTINLGSTFSDRTTIDGGVGNDLVNLTGNYMAGVVFLDTTMVNVETLQLGAGFNYRLTTSDATVAAGQTLTLQAQAVSTGHAVVFNGSAETDGSFVFDMGAGNDTVTGGAGDDVFNLTLGGNDHAHGGAGDDTFIMGATVHAPTILDGGDGNDVVDLAGNYTNLVFRATSLVSIETINLTGGFSYHMTMNDANVAAGQIMHINGAALTATDTFVFNGSAETDGRYFINGGAGNDHIIGGQGNDIIHAGAGNDVITGGGGQDVMLAGAGQDDFIYKAVMDSTSTNYDTIQGFDGSKDIFDFPFIVRGITTLTTGQLDLANFDTELSTVLSSSVLAGHHAVIFTPDSGTLKGDIFLVVDANNVAGYQAGQDYVIQLDSTSTNLNDITTASFH